MSGSCLGVFPEAAVKIGPGLQVSDSRAGGSTLKWSFWPTWHIAYDCWQKALLFPILQGVEKLRLRNVRNQPGQQVAELGLEPRPLDSGHEP